MRVQRQFDTSADCAEERRWGKGTRCVPESEQSPDRAREFFGNE